MGSEPKGLVLFDRNGVDLLFANGEVWAVPPVTDPEEMIALLGGAVMRLVGERDAARAERDAFKAAGQTLLAVSMDVVNEYSDARPSEFEEMMDALNEAGGELFALLNPHASAPARESVPAQAEVGAKGGAE